MKLKLDNFKYILISSSIAAFMAGIFGPFYVLYVQELGGGVENFGFAFGLLMLSSALTSYIIGKRSDEVGRKPFMIFSTIVQTILLISYLFITSVFQLFGIQILFGINEAIWTISEKTFLADITKKKSRGRMMGKYDAVISMLMGISMLFSGVLVGRMGIEIVFYLMAFATGISTIPLLFIKE